MRLIDADALNTYDVSPAYGMTVIGLTEEDIELAPTVDAIPVIRCKDCKWYGDGYLCYNTETLGMQPDDYCSLAERREE